MKFYYEGKLVRTSKNHTYTHAVMTPSGVSGCHSSKELAEQEIQSLINDTIKSIKFQDELLVALDKGVSRVWQKFGRKQFPVDTYRYKGQSYEERKEQIAENKQSLINRLEYQKSFKVVELECR